MGWFVVTLQYKKNFSQEYLPSIIFDKTEIGRQEYKTDAEIRQFAEKQDFPGTLMKLGNILGDDAPEVSSCSLWRIEVMQIPKFLNYRPLSRFKKKHTHTHTQTNKQTNKQTGLEVF